MSSNLTRCLFLLKDVQILMFRGLLPQMSVPNLSGLIEVQMGAHVLKLNKVPLFAKKPVNVNVARSAAPKLAIVLASRYNCDVK